VHAGQQHGANSRRQRRQHFDELEAVGEQHGEHCRGVGKKDHEGDPVGRP
jgi:hypothetical protein